MPAVDNFDSPSKKALLAFMESASFAKNPVGVPFDARRRMGRRRLRAGEPAADPGEADMVDAG